jgi:serine O-acetyltransferase
LISARRGPFRRVTKELLALYGVEVPPNVEIGHGLRVLHRGFGTVIHPTTRIGDNVTIYHGVTIGRGDAWETPARSAMTGVVIGDDVTICAGAKLICSRGTLTVGDGAIIGANAVVTRNVPAGEIWAGVPARKIRDR